MDQVNSAFRLVGHWVGELLTVLISIFGVVEGAAHNAMTRAGLPSDLQEVVLLGIGVVFVLAALRVFGGLLRLLIIVLLILFLLHVVAPMARI